MTKQCKRVLNNLKKLSGNTDCILAYLGGTSSICLLSDYSVVYDYSEYSSEICSIIDYLVSTGYLTYTNDSCSCFMLTHKGLHPHRVSWEAVKGFLIRSFITPIIVSVIVSAITTIVTLALANILG